jgi:hypothetical protein|tara:strand:- start:26 stop:469 length:444 start_codon:yes stop_codon:yes gene_type:complete
MSGTFAAWVDEIRGTETTGPNNNSFNILGENGELDEEVTVESGSESEQESLKGIEGSFDHNAPHMTLSGNEWLKATAPEIEQVELVNGEPQLTINGQQMDTVEAMDRFGKTFDMEPVINAALEKFELEPKHPELLGQEPSFSQQFLM